MRKVIATVIASTLAFSALSQAAEVVMSDSWSPADKVAPRSTYMFDGIRLTEQQRQQMRDLMQQEKYDHHPVKLSEVETMHRLVTAENFDEIAVRAQAEKMAQEQVAVQVKMARVRNQLFHLLTPEQQAILHDRHQQYMNQLLEAGRMQRRSETPYFSSSTRSNP